MNEEKDEEEGFGNCRSKPCRRRRLRDWYNLVWQQPGLYADLLSLLVWSSGIFFSSSSPFRICTETAERFAVLIYQIRMLLLLFRCPLCNQPQLQIHISPSTCACSVGDLWQPWKVKISVTRPLGNCEGTQFILQLATEWTGWILLLLVPQLAMNQQQNWPPGLDARWTLLASIMSRKVERLFAWLISHAEKHYWLIYYERNIVPYLINRTDKFKRTGR